MYLLILLLLVLGACKPAQGTDASDAPGTARSTAVADTSIRAEMQRIGFVLDRIVDERDDYVAALARRNTDQALLLVALRRDRSGVRLLGRPTPMMERYPPQLVSWVQLGGIGTHALTYTHNLPAEGVVGTVVYIVRGDSLALTYAARNGECRPAELRDVDGDGTMELVAYTEDPSGGACGSECHIDMEERFGAGPQWVDVHRWTGTGWEKANRAFPAFYALKARSFRSVQSWMESESDRSNRECRGMAWMTERPVFRDWAERAEALANPRDRAGM